MSSAKSHLNKWYPNDIPKVEPGAPRWKILGRWLQSLMVVSPDDPRAKLLFPSFSTIYAEKMRQYNAGLRYIIHPFSKFENYWRILMAFIWFVALCNDVYVISFYWRLILEGHHGIYWLSMLIICDAICLINVPKFMLTGYVDKRTNAVILEPKKIRRHVTYWVLIDVFSALFSIDTSVRFLINYEFYLPLYRFLLFLRYIRLLRLLTVFQYLKHLTEYLRISFTTYKYVFYCMLIFYIVHFTSCSYYFVVETSVQIFPEVLNRSWIQKVDVMCTKARMPCYSLQLYCHSLMETLVKFSIGGKTNVVPPELLIEIIFQCVILFSVYVLKIIIFVVLYQHFYETSETQLKMDLENERLNSYLDREKIPKELKKKVRKTRHLTKNFMMTYFRYLSPLMNSEIIYQIWKSHMRKSLLFTLLNHDTLVEMTLRMIPRIIMKDQVIYQAGDIADKFYLLTHGEVALFASDGTELTHLVDSECFGTGVVEKEGKRMTTCIAVTSTEVWYLKKEDVLYLCENYSDFEDIIYSLKHDYLALHRTIQLRTSGHM